VPAVAGHVHDVHKRRLEARLYLRDGEGGSLVVRKVTARGDGGGTTTTRAWKEAIRTFDFIPAINPDSGRSNSPALDAGLDANPRVSAREPPGVSDRCHVTKL
jgi:hypothetical protein